MTAPSADQVLDACPLSWPQQRRNLVLFASCTGMQYLAAPVLYVGITQAALCDRLEADARTSNLPATLFFAMTAVPAIIAWLSPQVASLKRNLMLCYAISGIMLATLAVTLLLPLPNWIKLTMVILQGGVAGAVMPAAIALLWEVIGRGSDECRRGLALSLAFGLGPILAVAGSFAQTALLGGDLFGWKFSGAAYPWNFVVLFGAGAPVMAVAALLCRLFVVPPVEREPQREPLSAVMPLLIGVPMMFASVALMHSAAVMGAEAFRLAGYLAAVIAAICITYYFRSLLRQRTLLLATVVTILVYAVNGSPSNMNLYSHEALGNAPEQYAGIQNMLRFGCKALAGGFLGWMLTWTNPRAGILATATICLASQLWAMLVTGPWYLASFVIFGAGELIGVYSPNYMVSASRTNDLRRTMAFATMLMVPAAPAGYLYGAIVDFVRSHELTAFGLTSESLGFRLSFLTSSLLILVGIVVALSLLPKKPRPS